MKTYKTYEIGYHFTLRVARVDDCIPMELNNKICSLKVNLSLEEAKQLREALDQCLQKAS